MISEEWGWEEVEFDFYFGLDEFWLIAYVPFYGIKTGVVLAQRWFLFLLVDFKFEKRFWRIETRGLKGIRFSKKWGLISD